MEALLNQVPMFSSGRSMMLSSLRSGESEAAGVEEAAPLPSSVAVSSVDPTSSSFDAVTPAASAAAPVAGPLFVAEKQEEVLPEKQEPQKAIVEETPKKKEDPFLAAAEEDDDGVPKVELFCMCQKPWNPNHFMVACDECNEWYHDTCLGIPQEELEKVEKFVCNWCIEKAKRQEQRRKQWEADKAAKSVAKKQRQAARKRELQALAKKVRSKPCRNVPCNGRSRPNSK